MEPPPRQPEVHDPGFAGRPIRVGGTILGAHRDICAFFHIHDDEYRVLLPFIKDGFENGEKAVHIIDLGRRDDHVRWLRDAGINVAEAQQAGQLELRGWAEAHLRGGSFDKSRSWL